MSPWRVTEATDADAAAVAALRNAAADALTARHGRGRWSHAVTENAVKRAIATSRVLVARRGPRVVGTLRLSATKPWAIDPSYFTAVGRPVYLHDMAISPKDQGKGLGRRMLEHAVGAAREWPAGAIRLDAYDASAGAGAFYARCGFREVGRVVYRGTPLVYFELVL